MKRKARRSRSSVGAPATRQSLAREDWIAAARAELVAGGVNAVKIVRLAKRLRVTRGSFYWHFTSGADLLRELLKSWEQTNTAPFERSLANGNGHNGVREFTAIMNLWLDESEYSPAFDTAVRDWARTSAAAASVVGRVDERRIKVLHRIFQDLGFREPEALVRARVAYFHQVGYYALEFKEERKHRLALAPTYMMVLTGLPAEVVEQAVQRRE